MKDAEKAFYARLFVYCAASLFTGSGMLLMLQTMQVFMEGALWKGVAGWLLLAASWANLTFLFTRRFTGGAFGYRWYPALFPVLMVLPLPLFMVLRDEALTDVASVIVLPLAVASCFFGYRLGVKAGEARRAAQQA
jgi:hypothetical protein